MFAPGRLVKRAAGWLALLTESTAFLLVISGPVDHLVGCPRLSGRVFHLLLAPSHQGRGLSILVGGH